jgi:vacuolar-type H+-ATPase subunit H
MENDILREIIDVEKEIQQSLDRAKIRTSEWLDARKKEIEDDLAGQEKEIAGSFQLAREHAVQDAVKKASEFVEQAKRQTEQIAHLENDTLVKIVMNHIHEILPG